MSAPGTLQVDLRMLRNGRNWSGVGTIHAPCYRAPVDILATADLGDYLPVVGGSLPRASAGARGDTREVLVKLMRNFMMQNRDDLGELAAEMEKRLQALESGGRLIARARRGDPRAVKLVEKISLSEKSRGLLDESREFLDRGRATLKLKLSLVREIPLALTPGGESTGFLPDLSHRRADYDYARSFPVEKKDLLDPNNWSRAVEFAIGALGPSRSNGTGRDPYARFYDPWKSLPYPLDTRGTDLVSNFQPYAATY